MSGKKKIYEGFGEMLFTHFGVSGPLILSASSYYAKKCGQSRAKLSMGDGKITLKDVAGLKEEKEELEEIVEFLKEPAKFTKVGARIPKGVRFRRSAWYR